MPSATFLHRMVSYYNDVADGCLGDRVVKCCLLSNHSDQMGVPSG